MKTGNLYLFITIIFLSSIGCQTPPEYQKISVEVYRDKVYGSWLAQCIGNIYGLPHENAHIDEPGPETFPYGYKGNADRLRKINGAFSDDDTDIEYMYLLAMEKHGPEPTYQQLADFWKYHVRDRVWLANRAALAAMLIGYTPPVTGFQEYNPHWYQIDPQLVNEIWAVTAPGMIAYAADKSAWAARITNDSWGIEPTIHYGAMYAAAFFESDVKKLIDIGTAALPPDSRFAQTVEDMKALHSKYPDDWQQARAEMADKYYHGEPDESKTIWNAVLNGACGILALLYGNGEFQQTLDLACAMGFDADNQAATMAGLLGIVLGSEGLPIDLLYFVEDWQKPFNDVYKNVTRYDMPDASLQDMANRMAALGEKILLQHGGSKITENGADYYLIDPAAEFIAPVELPGAPMPIIEAGAEIDFTFMVTGGKPPFQWQIVKGDVPEGLQFAAGRLSGTATKPGIYPMTLAVKSGDKQSQRDFRLIVRGKNLAPEAAEILANVKKTDQEVRDAMWLTIAHSLYASEVEVICDGRRTGQQATFYSINDSEDPKIDYYGYRWQEPQTIGLLALHTGAMEENGGWFTSFAVQWLDEDESWQSTGDLVVSPPLVQGTQPHNKPHFVEYLLAFQPVSTTAIRIIGDAGGAKHWRSKPAYFTSVSELAVYAGLEDYKTLAMEGN